MFHIAKFSQTLIEKFFRHKTLRMAASLAFYTSISLAPLLILFVSLSTKMSFDYRHRFIDEITDLIGPQGAEIFSIIMKNAEERSDLSALAGIISTIIMLITASFVFGELRSSLNEIFETTNRQLPDPRPPNVARNIFCFLKDNIFQIGMVISFFVILMVSLLISSFISSTFYWPEKRLAFMFNITVSLVTYAAIFTLLFRYLPNKKMPWLESLKGALVTALLFLIGKELIGFYLGSSGMSSAYGAAGSLVVFSSWIYYSAIIIFLGAEIIALNTHKNMELNAAY